MRKAILVICLAALWCLPASGAGVWGKVTDRKTGAAISSAYVEIFYFNPESVYVATGYTDGSGNYAFENVPPGTYLANSWTSGYDATRFYNVSVSEPGLRLDILLAPAAALTPGGVVIGQDSTAVGGAHMSWTNRVSGTEYEIDSDSAGSFSLQSLPPGSYDVTVTAAGYEQVSFAASLSGNFATYGIMLVPTGTTGVQEQSYPENVRLLGAYPNPFNPTVRIAYVLPAASDVRVEIYAASGQLVEVLRYEQQPPGERNAVWNARNFSSGSYYYRLFAREGNAQSVRAGSIVLLK